MKLLRTLGLALLVSVSSIAAAQTDTFKSWSPGTIGLLIRKDIRRDLNLNSDQAKQIDDIFNAKLVEHGGLKGLSLSPEDGPIMSKKLNEVLEPEQRTRLIELVVQVRGAGAITEPMVQEKLSLSKAQLDLLAEIEDDIRGAVSEEAMRQGGGTGGQIRISADFMRPFEERRAKVLNDEQRAKLKEMAGTRKFEADKPSKKESGN